MILVIILDAPFSANVKVSNWNVSTSKDQLEVSITKSSKWIVTSWIDTDWSSFFSANDLAVSSDGGSTWKFVTYFKPPDYQNCWIGDPYVAYEPSNPDKFYWVGMIYCNPNNPKGEIYFCTNNSTPDNASNWSCKILPPNDNWAYFKDKPNIVAIGNGIVLINYTTDKYGNYEILIARSSDYGNTWITIRPSAGVVSTVAYFSIYGSTIYLSQNNFNSGLRIDVRKSTNGGLNWSFVSSPATISTGSYGTSCRYFKRPAKIHSNITAYSNYIAVSYVSDYNGYCNVAVAYSNDGGSTWTRKFIYPSSRDQVLPMIASSKNGYLYVMWQELYSSTYSIWRTMFSYSTNWGSSFSTPSRVSDHNYKFNQNPAGHDYNGLVIDNSGVYAIWANDYYTDDAGLVWFSKATSSIPLANLNENKTDYNNAKIYSIDGKFLGNYNSKTNLKPGIYIIKSNAISKVFVIK